MAETVVNVESDVEDDIIRRRVDRLIPLLSAPSEVLETINEVLRINEEEEGARRIIDRLQSLYDVPVVGRIAGGVVDLLVDNLVARRTERLIARGVKPYTGPLSGTPTK